MQAANTHNIHTNSTAEQTQTTKMGGNGAPSKQKHTNTYNKKHEYTIPPGSLEKE